MIAFNITMQEKQPNNWIAAEYSQKTTLRGNRFMIINVHSPSMTLVKSSKGIPYNY